MAAIEKICELTGNYDEPWKMWKDKRNSIQVRKQFQSQFKGQTAVLMFFKQEQNPKIEPYNDGINHSNPENEGKFWVSYETWRRSSQRKLGGYTSQAGILNEHVFQENGIWYEVCRNRKASKWAWCKKLIMTVEHTYMLYVPGLPGNVDGHYLNHTSQKQTVIRKLKRLLGDYKLSVINMNMTCAEYYELKGKQ